MGARVVAPAFLLPSSAPALCRRGVDSHSCPTPPSAAPPAWSHAQIQAARRQFEEGRDDPPLTRNQPPVAGAIRWSRTLLARLRHTWVRLQGLGAELEALEPGRRAAAAMTGAWGWGWGDGC